jgi:hypothetical protein
MALGLTQPLNRNEYKVSSWGGIKVWPALKADLTTICDLIV